MRAIIVFCIIMFICCQISFARQALLPSDTIPLNKDKIVFAYGGQLNKMFLKYVVTLTKKSKPNIYFLPTASGDNPDYIRFWIQLCKQLSIEPHVVRTFSAASNTQSFDKQLLKADAIIAGAGNAVNMLAVWKAQGIDTILRKAYDRGIIMAGGSAGSLCWFTNSYTGSKPLGLTKIEGLHFLPFSYCPHYHSELRRKPMFQEGIINGDIPFGYACDDLAGLLFVNGKMLKSVTQNKSNNSFFITIYNQHISEEQLKSDTIK